LVNADRADGMGIDIAPATLPSDGSSANARNLPSASDSKM
jgi:hypothetical protein